MALESLTYISIATRILGPLISDLYKSAKEYSISGLNNWKDSTFPARLAKKIENLGKVKTLWSPENDIALSEFYYPPYIQNGKTSKKRKIECINDLGVGNIVIQGIVGQGKSILLRHLAINEAIKSDSSRIPIFIELRTLHSSLTLMSAIFNNLSSYEIEIDNNTFEHLAKSAKIVLLLDAFDELDENLTRTTLNDIEFLSRKYPTLQIVITSRPGNEIQKTSGFSTIHIAPLEHRDFAPFLSRLNLPPDKIFDIGNAIDSSETAVYELITTPLMLTLVVIVYESEREIPPALPDFFERLFQVVFSRHDRLKAGFNRKKHTNLSDRKLQDLFEAFCFMTIQHSFGRTLSAEQFSKAFGDAIKYSSNINCTEESFRSDIVKVACLMLEEGVDLTTFLHRSLIEYYAAAFIKHSADEVANLFYQSVSENYHSWIEVVKFLQDIDPYRYSKGYALIQTNRVECELEALLQSKDEADLLNYLSKIHPDLGLKYRYNSNSKLYRISSYGPFAASHASTIHALLDDYLISALESTLPPELSAFELSDIIGRSGLVPEMEEEVRISVRTIINHFNSDGFWLEINRYKARIGKIANTAREIIENQQKRRQIFLIK